MSKFRKQGSLFELSEVVHNFRGSNRAEITISGNRTLLPSPHCLVSPTPENGQKTLLRNVDAAYPLHALLAFFLLFQQFALSADIAAITLGDHVLTQGSNRLASDYLGSD